MFSFDKLALLIVSLICLGCVMFIGLQPGQATANATMILGGLVGFLGSAQGFLFSVLKAEARAQAQPPAAPVAAPVPAPTPVAAESAPPAAS